VFHVLGIGFGVWGFDFRVPCFGFRVSGFGFRVPDFGFRVSGSGFRFSGVWVSGSPCIDAGEGTGVSGSKLRKELSPGHTEEFKGIS